MTKEDFVAGKIYIFVNGYTKRCFKCDPDTREIWGHLKRKKVWGKAKKWWVHSFFDGDDLILRYEDMEFITPDDYLLDLLGEQDQL